MQQLHYSLGLPRTCSSVIMNILNENPRIFTTGTCPLTYFIDACQQQTHEITEFLALDKDVLNKSYINFLRQGIRGWFEVMTDKPIVFSKSRVWPEYFNHTFAFDPNSKYLVILRDLRDIICSLDSLLWKYPQVKIRGNNFPLHMRSFKQRVDLYCGDEFSNLGRPLSTLPHVIEMSQKSPNSFFLLKHEHFNEKPKEIMQEIYKWMGEKYFEHDFDNIPKPDYYEHDTVYRAQVSHKTGTKLKKLEPRWPQLLTDEQSKYIIEKNRSYYEIFYPEAL